jgi:hypothetical protein
MSEATNQQPTNEPEAQYFTAQDLAEASGKSVRAIGKIAVRERWPVRFVGTRMLLQPPAEFAARLPGGSSAAITSAQRAEALRLKFRAECVFELDRLIQNGTPIERALTLIAETFSFNCSVSSLRRWQKAFATKGLRGLLENKVGNVGRKREL